MHPHFPESQPASNPDAPTPASFRQRSWASAIDAAVTLLLIRIVLAVIGIVQWYIKGGGTSTFEVQSYNPVWYGHLALAAVTLLLYMTLTTYYWNGQTIGKNILKIRVISAVNLRMTHRECFYRAIGLLIGLFQLGYGAYRFHRDDHYRPLQDRIAETNVIDEPIPPPEPQKKQGWLRKRRRL